MMTNRRTLIMGGAASLAFPRIAAGQQTRPRRVGILVPTDSQSAYTANLEIFKKTLSDSGWQLPRDVEVSVFWASANREQISAAAREMVAAKLDVIVPVTTVSVVAIREVSRETPVVFVLVSDPLGRGIVDSISRPSGSITGFSNLELSMAGKWLGLMKALAPETSRVGVPIHVSNAVSGDWFKAFENFAPAAHVQTVAIPIQDLKGLEIGISDFVKTPGGALIVPGDGFLSSPPQRKALVALARPHALPVLSGTSGFTEDGGLASYGIDNVDQFRLAANYVDRILRGEKTTNLPVQQPTKFKFSLNLATARAFDLTLPPNVVALADEIIE